MNHRAALLRSALCLTTAKPRPSPTLFCFPGLESAPWHDASKFEWTKHLEANRETITNEFLALQRSREEATQSKETSDYKVYDKEHQLHQGQWDWLSYVTQGRRQADFAVQCPKTVEILESIPGFMAGLPFAYAFFSILKPESSIKAHSAPCNIRLRCHFPLIVPEGCGIRVGDETRQWEEGKALVLDDAFDHEVWHNGKKGDRVLLLFDFWHPDLIPEEREAITEMFKEAKEKGWLKDYE
ncbi:Aspartate beta-hydroxylase domain-containing protein 2 [Phytophthora boehmeriae]|uniref:Aspartate beta-hydroxylase domain-containing protein 2 n=1 Tax=Phytophthora boehmeriae TaxID=109152 RepID=A0A8T1WTN8_9STRA|nr:Aspartate beta-hydroxylase domain-containing protein 2 [Phytophthora boehmeriae]